MRKAALHAAEFLYDAHISAKFARVVGVENSGNVLLRPVYGKRASMNENDYDGDTRRRCSLNKGFLLSRKTASDREVKALLSDD